VKAKEVDDFAAYVRGLKERSERSYGALARRLNVGASTLHRYCNGEAVPSGFALLERLAQLCGATPEERVELHRLWVAAANPKANPKAKATATANQAPEPEPEPVPEPAPPPRRRRRWVVAAVGVGAVGLVVAALAALIPGSAGEPEPKPAPLSWTADSQVWQYGCDHRYVVDRPAGEVPAPPVEQDARAWAEPLGAVHGGDTVVRVTVQGRGSAAVVLNALRVRVVERAAPAPGNVFRMNDGCGGALTPRTFEVDLDADRPTARSRPGNDAGEEIPAVTFPYRVSAGEPEVLLVTARTARCDCRWYLELEWSSQGRGGTARIDDGGRPFRTSGVEGLPAYGYDTASGRWRLVP
jgi:transcriptional regulator with XRE-family HTH domain